MSVIDRLLSVFAPYECLSCQMEGNLLCMACIQQLPPAAKNHPRYRAISSLDQIQAATAYTGVAKDLVWKFKSSGAQAAAHSMAACMARLMPDGNNDWLVMAVPTASSRVRQRGYDQAKLLARELSRATGLRRADHLSRMGHTHQVGADRNKRLTQLQDSFRVINPRKVQGANIMLIDDVTTTGATLEAAAKALKLAGANGIEALVFCAA